MWIKTISERYKFCRNWKFELFREVRRIDTVFTKNRTANNWMKTYGVSKTEKASTPRS
jgi:hypothetical protein